MKPLNREPRDQEINLLWQEQVDMKFFFYNLAIKDWLTEAIMVSLNKESSF